MKIKDMTVEKIEKVEWHPETLINTGALDTYLDADMDIKREIVIIPKITSNKN
jgi:hypothetical protein